MIFIDNLRLKYQNSQAEWSAKTPKQKWELIYNTGRLPSKIMGMGAYEGRDNNWLSKIAGAALIICYFLIFYTIQGNIRRKEYIKTIENCCSIGVLTSVN